MTRLTARLLPLLASLCCAASLYAQREVTPVESDDKKPAAPVLHYYDKHGNPLDEPVLFLATLDTVAPAKVTARPVYPTLTAVEFGLNFFDAITAIAGQKYGGADLTATLSLWNWLMPAVELGLGGADNTPKGNNYTYKSGPSFYMKIGADYNFLYKSNPDYRLIAGLRLGVSPFSYRLTDVSISPGYWGDAESINLPAQSSTALYGEILLGLRVRIWKAWSLGWSIRFHHLFHTTGGEAGQPWYIPGMGAKNSKIGATFSVAYTLPLGKRTEVQHENTEKQ